MTRIRFDPREPGLELVRQVVLDRLIEDPGWNSLKIDDPEPWDSRVEYYGNINTTRDVFLLRVLDVLWELIIQGVLAPGRSPNQPDLPWFHLTDYGKQVLAERRYLPHDPDGYLKQVSAELPAIDSVVLVYLTESLQCFVRGLYTSSTLMLGVAAERTFLMVSRALVRRLGDAAEKTKAEKVMGAFAMKPKLDWVLAKTQRIVSRRPRPATLPKDLEVMLLGVYNFIRAQRNELGHPQANPPAVTRDQAFVNLRLFPPYYKVASDYIKFVSRRNV